MKYLKLGFYYTKELYYYSYTLIFRNIWFLLILYMLMSLVLYSAGSKGVTHIGVISVEFYIWYVFITELVMMNRRDDDVTSSVKSGNIITLLNKPIHFIWMQMSKGFFRALLKIIIMTAFSIGFILWWSGNFPWFGIWNFLLFLLSFLVGILLLALGAILIGMLSFVVEDSNFVTFMLSKVYFIFGGVFFPLGIYPMWLQTIAKFLPFQYYIYGPARFFVTGDINFFWSYFPIQVGWLFAVSFFVLYAYGRVVRRLEVNGG